MWFAKTVMSVSLSINHGVNGKNHTTVISLSHSVIIMMCFEKSHDSDVTVPLSNNHDVF